MLSLPWRAALANASIEASEANVSFWAPFNLSFKATAAKPVLSKFTR